jgi:hypothetical protein
MRASALALALFLTACATVAPPPLQEPALVDRLFCGLAIPGGGTVSEQELRTFVDEVVIPRFPEGFTVYRVEGVYRGGRENTIVIEIVHKPQVHLERQVEEIAEEYRKRFRQTSVLRVTTPAGMSFID